MGNKVDISEVIELSDELKTTSAEIKSSLDSLQADIDQIIAMDSFSGKTAKLAKNYFGDLHKTVLDAFNGLFTDLHNNLKQHLDMFQSEVDSSQTAIIDSDYLTDTEMDVDKQFAHMEYGYQSVNNTINSVSDISCANTPNFSHVANKENKVIEEITDLNDKFTAFTSEGKQHDSQTKELLHHINVAIKSTGRSTGVARFTDYTTATAYVGLPVLKDHINSSTEEKDKIENLDDDSKAIIDKAEEDYEEGLISKEIYDSIVTGVLSSGSGFLKQVVEKKLTDEATKAMAAQINNWIQKNTFHFTNLGVAVQSSAGPVSTFGVPISKLSSIIRTGARYGIPIIGAVLDYNILILKGDNSVDAAVKAGGHAGIGVTAGAIGFAIGGPLGAGVAFFGALGGNWVFDKIYNNKEKIIESVVDFGTSVANTAVDVGNSVVDTVQDIASDVGDAVSGFFGNLGSVFG